MIPTNIFYQAKRLLPLMAPSAHQCLLPLFLEAVFSATAFKQPKDTKSAAWAKANETTL